MEAMSAPLQAPGAASATILVVDDEPYIADLLSAGLRFEGFGVEVASTAEEALATTARCEPDLVLLDVMLPDLDGTELSAPARAGFRGPCRLRDGQGRHGGQGRRPGIGGRLHHQAVQLERGGCARARRAPTCTTQR